MNSIKMNFFYNVTYQMVTILLPLLTMPYLSRILGPEGIGIQSYTTAVSSYFVLAGTLGTAAYGRREMSMLREEKTECSKVFWEITLLRGMTTGISLIVYILVIWHSKQCPLFLMVNTILIITSVFDFTWYFQGVENFRIVVMRNIAIRITGTAALFLLIHEKEDLLLYMLLLGLTNLLGNLSVLPYLKHNIAAADWKEIHPFRHLKDVIVYFIPSIAISVYTVLDKLMLGTIVESSYENGYYEQSEKVINMVKNIIFSINVVVGSRISYLYKKGQKEEIHSRLENSIKFLLLLAIPSTLGILGIASGLVPWFLGKDFLSCIPIIQLQSILILITGFSNCIGAQCLTPLGKRKQSNYVLCTGAAVNFLLNLVLIPRWGAMGATVATVAAEIIITCFYFYLGREYFSIRFIARISMKYLAAGTVMLLCVSTLSKKLPATMFGSCAEIITGAGVYAGTLFMLRDEFFVRQVREVVGHIVKY